MTPMKNNVIYYTIIKKEKYKTNESFTTETLQAQNILYEMLDYLNIKHYPIYRTKLGKPYFKNVNLHFNYSHSQNYIVCAISNVNIGVDIEETNQQINDVMIKKCGFDSNNKLEDFVRREAFCKLTGKGIAHFFDKSTFLKNKNDYLIVKNKNYICSIYSKSKNFTFEFIQIKK